MLEKMIFGRFIPGSSFIHKLDPRAKLSFVFLFIIAVFLANNACDVWFIVRVYIARYLCIANSFLFFI